MATIVHFDIAADDPQRAKNFYESLFGWKIEQPPGPMEYYLIETEDLNGVPGLGGGMGKRGRLRYHGFFRSGPRVARSSVSFMH